MLFCAFVMKAQSNIVHELEADVPGQGSVKVNQPARLFDLMGSMVTIDGKAPEVEAGTLKTDHHNNIRRSP